ncbi:MULTISPECIES: hypothetical protein [unclassified Helicobacter]|uniref:hypothetical protein n=1 Tax=unclassified Helicobacter TaxID=2593540 RepID=UPI00115FDC27|nr:MULTISPECIES: hypothetical protein [unclassified Helicobacter]
MAESLEKNNFSLSDCGLGSLGGKMLNFKAEVTNIAEIGPFSYIEVTLTDRKSKQVLGKQIFAIQDSSHEITKGQELTT